MASLLSYFFLRHVCVCVCGSRLCLLKLSQVNMPESTCGKVSVCLRDRKRLVKLGKHDSDP